MTTRARGRCECSDLQFEADLEPQIADSVWTLVARELTVSRGVLSGHQFCDDCVHYVCVRCGCLVFTRNLCSGLYAFDLKRTTALRSAGTQSANGSGRRTRLV